MQQIKSYSIFSARQTDRQTDAHFASLYAQARFFLYGNLYLSLHYIPLFASLTSFVKDKQPMGCIEPKEWEVTAL